MSNPARSVKDMIRALESASKKEVTIGRRTITEPIRSATSVAQRIQELQGRRNWENEEKEEVGESSIQPSEDPQLPTYEPQEFGNASVGTSSEFVIIAGEIYTNEEIFGDDWGFDEEAESSSRPLADMNNGDVSSSSSEEGHEAIQGSESENQGGATNEPGTLADMVQVARQSRILLTALGDGLPISLKSSGAKLDKDFLASNEGAENPILLLSRLANVLRPEHEKLFISLKSAEDNRNGQEMPNIADSLLEFVNSVECFEPLLAIKNECIPEIQKMRSADQALDRAIGEFEATMAIPKGESKIVELKKADKFLLDKMASELLTTPKTYAKGSSVFLRLSSAQFEKQKLAAAIKELEEIASYIDERDLELPDQSIAFSLDEKSNGLFNALERGRMLIHHSKVKEYLNGALKSRYLVIFSDGMWLCKPKLIGNAFDMAKSRFFPFSSILVKSFEWMKVQKWTVINSETLDHFELVFKNIMCRIHLDSFLHFVKEKLNKIEDHQLKTNSN
ncbi:hypothetical protein CAEBREN_08531 [Caenorhabditis brenneri]|uniref:Uncharacterized protein n=1 Tax=Caenorhabditis brenneri TaxID=135651 RepID=G0MH68_CAEBE|nr:hypothetical protein CAEBREN_08531 [Caenorhabditis brenneri]